MLSRKEKGKGIIGVRGGDHKLKIGAMKKERDFETVGIIGFWEEKRTKQGTKK